MKWEALLLAMPIKDNQNGNVLGVIAAFNKNGKNEWTKDDRIALGVICSHTSMVLGDTYMELKQKITILSKFSCIFVHKVS